MRTTQGTRSKLTADGNELISEWRCVRLVAFYEDMKKATPKSSL
ncbi:hypothetical protein [Xenorhabdus vietnamensis]|nr:hypothetical protein [Xenorhabdus vietnamensis]